MSLHELQQAFSAALLHGASADHLIAGPRGLGAADAAAIYRDALFANYRRALAASFPVVERLIGPDCFRQTVDALVGAARGVGAFSIAYIATGAKFAGIEDEIPATMKTYIENLWQRPAFQRAAAVK